MEKIKNKIIYKTISLLQEYYLKQTENDDLLLETRKDYFMKSEALNELQYLINNKS